MTRRIQRLNLDRLHFTTIPDQRVTDITTALTEQRANRRSAVDDLDRDTADRNVSDLEVLLERAKANEQAHIAHMARLQADEEAKRQQHHDAELAKVTDQLRERYLRQPGATEQEFNEVLPDLLKEQRKQAALGAQTEFDRQVAEQRRRMQGMF